MKRAYELTVLYAPDLISDELKLAQDAVAGHVTTLGGKISKKRILGSQNAGLQD